MRQPGAEMNETCGMSASEDSEEISPARITQSIIIILTYPLPGYASLAILSQLIPGYASLRLDILSSLILGYPNLQNLYRDILGYHPDLPRVSFF